MRTALLILLAGGMLAGCGGPTDEEAKASRRDYRAARAKANEAKLAAPPGTRIHQVGGNQLVVLDVPVPGIAGIVVERQRCFVWRDAEYKTASLSCPHPPEASLDDPDDGR